MTSDHGRGRAHGHGQVLQRTVAVVVAQEDKGNHSRHFPPLGTPVGTPEKWRYLDCPSKDFLQFCRILNLQLFK